MILFKALFSELLNSFISSHLISSLSTLASYSFVPRSRATVTPADGHALALAAG
jgi:hypothetical protein